jgi:hypothetical protein
MTISGICLASASGWDSGGLEAQLCTDTHQPERLGQALRRDGTRSPLREEVMLDGMGDGDGRGAMSVALSAFGRGGEGGQVGDAVRPPSISARSGEASV